jgi:hypothetical protein
VFSLARAQDSSQPADTVSVSTTTASPSTAIVTETGTSSPAPRTSSEPDNFPQDSPEEIEEAKRIVATCYPGYFENKIDWTAPCAAVQIIQAECTWGPDARQKLQDMFGQTASGEEPGFLPEDWEQQPLDVQRACFCSSQYADIVLGCGACLATHGVELDVMASYIATSNTTAVEEFTKMYCDADMDPTSDNAPAAFDVLLGQRENYAVSVSAAPSTASDSLGTATAVSLYFTPSVSSAYTVDMPTASSSADQTHPNAWYTYTSLSTSDGLIVPTAVSGKTVTASPPDASQSGAEASGAGDSTATAAAGAMQTAMVHSGFSAGALGVVALVFAL